MADRARRGPSTGGGRASRWIGVGLALVLIGEAAAGLGRPDGTAAATAAPIARPVAALASAAGVAPALFVENVGQFPEPARFVARGVRGTLTFAGDAVWATLLDAPGGPASLSDQLAGSCRRALAGLARFWSGSNVADRCLAASGETAPRQGVHLRVSYSGANPDARVEGFDPRAVQIAYLRGDDPAGWQPSVPVWGGVRYVDLFPGIDLEISGADGRYRQRFVIRDLAAGGLVALRQTSLRVEGADDLRLADPGTLQAATGFGEVTIELAERPAVAVEDDESARLWLAAPAEPRIETDAVLSPFRDADAPLAAVAGAAAGLAYGTYLGGLGADLPMGIAVDGGGSAYVAGVTFSTDFPTTPGAFQTRAQGLGSMDADAFVIKLRPDGSGLIYATFLGGDNVDLARDLAVDSHGRAVVVGSTASTDFPTTVAYTRGQRARGITPDPSAFVTRLDPSGSSIAMSTRFGGREIEAALAVALDAADNAYITGLTDSPDLPVTPGSFGPRSAERGSITADGFVAGLTSTTGELIYAGYLGGQNVDLALDIAVDWSGNAHVTGVTVSDDFPTTPGAPQPAWAVSEYGLDGFVAKIAADGRAIDYATYVGWGGEDALFAIGVDAAGQAVVGGATTTGDLPTTPGVFQPARGGGTYPIDAFVVRLSADGSEFRRVTYLGGRGVDLITGLAIDVAGGVALTGGTFSTNFPITRDAAQTSNGGGILGVDGFVAWLSADFGSLRYSGYLGGSGEDIGLAVAIDDGGGLYATGATASIDFPVTAGAFQGGRSGTELVGLDGFVVKSVPLGGKGSDG